MPEVHEDHGMLFYGTGDDRELVPHLLVIEGQVYEPSGVVEGVTPEQAERHNDLFDQALINGLKTCEINQRGNFYYNEADKAIKTFTGKVVANNVTPVGNVVTFKYAKRTFQGRLRKDVNVFTFRRTA